MEKRLKKLSAQLMKDVKDVPVEEWEQASWQYQEGVLITATDAAAISKILGILTYKVDSSLGDLLKSVERELGMRHKVYSKKGWPPDLQKEYDRMKDLQVILKELNKVICPPPPTTLSLFNETSQ